MNVSSPVIDPVTPLTAAPAILTAAHLILPHLERGQRVDTADLRSAMESAFGASDASGAWDWKLAYEACEVATVLQLRRVRVMGANRIELTGFTDTMRERLRAYGLFSEIISWKLRFFVPVDSSGPTILGKLFDRWPVERIGERAAA